MNGLSTQGLTQTNNDRIILERKVRRTMDLKSLLADSASHGEFTTADARKLLSNDWRLLIGSLPDDTKREAETFFYFVEGFVEEVDEGFVDDGPDAELMNRAVSLLSKL